MSVNIPDKDQLDTTSKTPSGKKMIYDKEFPEEIIEKYKENINEGKEPCLQGD